MERIEKSVDVDVPLNTCYNQWTQFEDFPQFMEGIKEVRQIDDRRVQWRAEIGGQERSWEAEIYRQVPDREIAWRATTGKANQGRVTFESLGPQQCRVKLLIEFEPEGAGENVANALGLVDARVKGDMKRFKEFIEKRGVEKGAWRGEIRSGEVRTGTSSSSSSVSTPTRPLGSTRPGTSETVDRRAP